MIGIFFLNSNSNYPFDNNYYVDSYTELISVIKNRGVDYRIVRGKETYLGDGNFSRSWILEGRNVVEVGPVKVDVIYNKGHFEFDDIKVVTHPWVDQLVLDKKKLADMVGDACPLTYLVKDREDLVVNLDKYFDKQEVLVLKPNKGGSGIGVVIGTPSEILDKADIRCDYVLQKLIGSSCGYKNLISGVHDFRLIIANGNLMYGVIRIPKEGSLLTNFAQGATRKVLEKSEIPEEFVIFAKYLDDTLFGDRGFDRVLAFDCMNTVEGIKLVEINGSVGLDKSYGSPSIQNFHEFLVNILLDYSL